MDAPALLPSPWRISIITLMPEMYPGPLGCSLIGDALARGLWELSLVNLRDFGVGPHQKVDDSPAGGGAGMVLKPEVVDAAIEHAKIVASRQSPVASRQEVSSGQRPEFSEGKARAVANSSLSKQARYDSTSQATGDWRLATTPQLIHFSPRGERMTQPLFRELIATPLILLCGRYEAIDERVLEKHQPREVSLGDFVLTGGDIPAMALVDGCVRLLPGVIGKEASLGEESFGDGEYANLLEYPHYTKPAEWEGRAIPEVLLSGHHKNIDQWRLEQAKAITRARRPDLLK